MSQSERSRSRPERPLPAPAVVVTNAPGGSTAAHALLQQFSDLGPLAVLVAGNVRVPGGVTAFRIQARATTRNVAVLRAAVRWLREGGRLVVLRGAEATAPLRGRVAEARWGALVRRLAHLGHALVVPAYVPVPGSRLARFWQLLLPPRAQHAPGGSDAPRLGEPLSARKLAEFEADFDVGRCLRLRIGMLGASAQGRGVGHRQAAGARKPVAEGPGAAALRDEIAALDEDAHLLDASGYTVYCAPARHLPRVLREIGRLREITFRTVGEGTGGDVDLDIYDQYYYHLFIWSPQAQEIVGGYRLGLADDILSRFGKKGLYSHTLFRFKTRLIEQINPAIELGRSFVRPEYQRDYAPLMLLWKGIAGFVSRNPRYRVLFGPVSISADYETTSQQLLVDFLEANSSRRDLARQVHPRRPFRGQRRAIWRRARFAGIDSIEDVSELIAQIEPDDKGVPVLLRQYLKLGGKLLGFNVDDQFSDVLDGLIMVDLVETDQKALGRYMGREAVEAYQRWHREHPRRMKRVS